MRTDELAGRLDRLRRRTSREVLSFAVVGGAGYVVDVAAFNVLRSAGPLSGADPVAARVVAVAVAMLVTYAGSSCLTWRDAARGSRRRETALFVVFNLAGLCFSVASLLVSHDLLGLTGQLADNVAANVVGVGLGTLFRFWTYRRFVFAAPAERDRWAEIPRLSGWRQVQSPRVSP